MKTAMVVIAAVVLLLVGALAWMGVLGGLPVEERTMGPYPFVYVQEASTDFQKIGRLTAQLGQRLEDTGFRERKPARVYYPPDRGIQNQIGFVTERAVTRATLTADEYFRPIPEQACMVASFPFRNSMSFRLGAWRAERAFAAHRESRRYRSTSVIVIQDGSRILYLQPIEAA
ncbi:MAG TPA: hypothetical protein VM369_03395 [Candidatus Binatia bacterium]|nr:hypothetical protein [Candidatus Binatia bacterium]